MSRIKDRRREARRVADLSEAPAGIGDLAEREVVPLATAIFIKAFALHPKPDDRLCQALALAACMARKLTAPDQDPKACVVVTHNIAYLADAALGALTDTGIPDEEGKEKISG